MTGIQLITAERIRQPKKYDAAHDDKHDDGSLAQLAVYLAAPVGTTVPAVWINEEEGIRLLEKHGHHPYQCLVIAGALIAAEIDRRLRVLGKWDVVAPPIEWDLCQTNADRIARIEQKISEFGEYMVSDDASADEAFEFGIFASQTYLPWCIACIRELGDKVAQYEVPNLASGYDSVTESLNFVESGLQSMSRDSCIPRSQSDRLLRYANDLSHAIAALSTQRGGQQT